MYGLPTFQNLISNFVVVYGFLKLFQEIPNNLASQKFVGLAALQKSYNHLFHVLIIYNSCWHVFKEHFPLGSLVTNERK